MLASALVGTVPCALGLFRSGRPEETSIFRSLVRLTGSVARSGVRAGARTLGKVPFLRSTWVLLHVLRDFARDPWRHPATFEQYFERPDPWGYDTPDGRQRLLHAHQILQAVCDGRIFRHGLEVGCAEGAFTELLAPHCELLLAVDFAPTPLGRAQQRCAHLRHVEFQRWDLRHDSLPRKFDLIIVMDVLDTVFRPAAFKAASEKLVNGLEPGGYLLVGGTRQSEFLEKEWFGKKFIRGGKWVNAFLANHPAVRFRIRTFTATHVFTLLQKVH